MNSKKISAETIMLDVPTSIQQQSSIQSDIQQNNEAMQNSNDERLAIEQQLSAVATDLEKNKKEMEEFIQTAKEQLQVAVNEAYELFQAKAIADLELNTSYDFTIGFNENVTHNDSTDIPIGDQTITINVPSFNFQFSDNSHLKWINTLLAANCPSERFTDDLDHSIGIAEELPLWQFINQMREKVLGMNLTFLCIEQYAADWLKEYLGKEDFYAPLGLAQPNDGEKTVKKCIEKSVTQCMNRTGKPMVFQSILAMSHPYLRDGEEANSQCPTIDWTALLD